MKICNVCLKSDFLCSGCSKKAEEGLISKTDIDLSRALFRLGIETDFMKSFPQDNYVFVLASKKQAGLLIGREGKNAKRLSIMLDKNLRVVENTDDERKLIERVLGVQVLGINKVYGDNELYKIRVEKRFRDRLVPPAAVSKIINKNAQFVFE